MRYRLRSLLIVLALGSLLGAILYWAIEENQCPKSGWTAGDFAGVLPIAAMIGTLLIAPIEGN